ncbi:hypothetical protein [Deinococcus cellulosilyticus]|uniref:Polyketide cyclase n=1 Tax=Deinococcus cellulosilyticus (strain DSM 18568 / NBRC 106333 / KACC 11606 / 5516J-15) TaxID=1223518 RepID=A0A511MZV9_DEIC1|nr:hypothetical protein [Deinococcus cellulosilyticus]GEM46160.1 hypothetical protein DC3_17950 [Deinococcus cellulosilyticus NBRC 106333 = KACC 11606]
MNSYKHTERLSTAPGDLWKVLTDVAHWSTWDPEVESATLEGIFRQGAKGTIKHKNGAVIRFSVLLCDVGQSYIISTTLALGVEMLTKRYWEQDGKDLLLTQEVTLIGPMAPIFMRMRKEGLSRNVPAALLNIKGLLEPHFQQGTKETINRNMSGENKPGSAF